MAITTKGNELILKKELTNAGSLPSIWYVGLATSSTPVSGSSSPSEPTGGYARVPVNVTSGCWVYDSSTLSIKNATKISFAQSSEDWGIIQEVFLASLSSGATAANPIYFYDVLTPPIQVQESTIVTFEPGTIKISRENT